MKILVTGGAGFIGSHLVDILVSLEHEVIIVDNLSTGSKDNLNPLARFYKLDINSSIIKEIFKEQIDLVVHLAAQVSVGKSMQNQWQDAFTNINGSLNLIDLSKRYLVKKFIYINSAAIFGHPQLLPISEDHPRLPVSNYGISKGVVEEYLNLSNLNFVSLRLANVYGPRQTSSTESGVISIFISKILTNQPLIIDGDGSQTRDFVFVKDVVGAILCSIESGNKSCFNIGTGKQLSILQLARELSKITGKNTALQYAAARSGDIKDSVFNIEKARQVLNWAPETDLTEGLLQTINHEKNNKQR